MPTVSGMRHGRQACAETLSIVIPPILRSALVEEKKRGPESPHGVITVLVTKAPRISILTLFNYGSRPDFSALQNLKDVTLGSLDYPAWISLSHFPLLKKIQLYNLEVLNFSNPDEEDPTFMSLHVLRLEDWTGKGCEIYFQIIMRSKMSCLRRLYLRGLDEDQLKKVPGGLGQAFSSLEYVDLVVPGAKHNVFCDSLYKLKTLILNCDIVIARD
ncbi:hypothetical protein FRB94_005724 [Tulasnella sp. JGI-2019a]|nr:hypothetical protein FRB94_005724 [Tulasnella sp. JGI-2019a]